MSITLTAADIRAIRPFKMLDPALESYGALVTVLDPFGIESSSAVSDTIKKTYLFALLAAHAATLLREPEPASTGISGGMTITWNPSNSFDKEALRHSGPGKMFLSAWSKLNRGWVLR